MEVFSLGSFVLGDLDVELLSSDYREEKFVSVDQSTSEAGELVQELGDGSVGWLEFVLLLRLLEFVKIFLFQVQFFFEFFSPMES
jgi:hypothetical protein